MLTAQLKLSNSEIEIICIDEFKLQSRSSNMYGWWRKEVDRWITNYASSFSMSFIIAYSSSKFYGKVGTSDTFNILMFGYFLNQLMQILNENSKSSSENRVLVMGNAVIHKSSYFQSLISGKKINIMFIPLYEPSLNPAEN